MFHLPILTVGFSLSLSLSLSSRKMPQRVKLAGHVIIAFFSEEGERRACVIMESEEKVGEIKPTTQHEAADPTAS
jgi:hypothetical protein